MKIFVYHQIDPENFEEDDKRHIVSAKDVLINIFVQKYRLNTDEEETPFKYQFGFYHADAYENPHYHWYTPIEIQEKGIVIPCNDDGHHNDEDGYWLNPHAPFQGVDGIRILPTLTDKNSFYNLVIVEFLPSERYRRPAQNVVLET